jgi:hypothetical protein
MPIYKEGDYVQVTSLFTIDSYLGLEVGDIFCIEKDCPHEGGILFRPNGNTALSAREFASEEDDGCYVLLYSQIEPVDSLLGEMFRKN